MLPVAAGGRLAQRRRARVSLGKGRGSRGASLECSECEASCNRDARRALYGRRRRGQRGGGFRQGVSAQGVPAPVALTPGALTPSVPAWVQVSVATVWIHPTSPRPLDGPALNDPARIGTWLDSMKVEGRLGLHGRIDTQMVYGRKVMVLSESGKWSGVAIPSQTGNHFPNGVIGWVPSAQLAAVAPPRSPPCGGRLGPLGLVVLRVAGRGRRPPPTSQLCD